MRREEYVHGEGLAVEGGGGRGKELHVNPLLGRLVAGDHPVRRNEPTKVEGLLSVANVAFSWLDEDAEVGGGIPN